MKPIGIGNLEKAQPKPTNEGKSMLSRHEMHTSQPDPLTIPLEHVITPQKENAMEADQEGQLSIDVYQTETELIVIAPVAGTPPDQLNVSITDDVITIKGRRELPELRGMSPRLRRTTAETLSEDSAVYLQECFWGNFSRSLILPVAVDLNHVEARFKNNVLTIRIPKTERVRTRVIRIEE